MPHTKAIKAILRTNQHHIHATALAGQPADQPADEQHDERPIVLIVDDEPDVGIILQQLLRPYAATYDIRSACDTTDALQCIASGRVSFLITDFNMLEVNGLSMAAAVKRHSPGTPVLLITAYSTSLLEQLARQYLVDYYMTKPFRLSALEQVIATALAART